MLSLAVQEIIRSEMRAAARDRRKDTVDRLAKLYGCSRSTIYRIAQLGAAARKRSPAKPEYRRAVRVAVDLAHRAPEPAPMDLALQAAVDADLIAAAAVPPLSTANRIAREDGLRPLPRRTQRLHADYPMQAIQIDGTTSKFLAVGDPRGDNDYELRLVSKISARGYKNKPLAAHRLRLQAYGIWDMCTGYTRGALCVARGESALDQMEALCSMLAETGDPRRPLHGVPDHIWSDNGAWCKSPPVRELIERLESNLVRGAPYNSERQGGVERPWRTLWRRFESSLYMRAGDSRTILLSDLRKRLDEYERRENALRRSRMPVVGIERVSRADAWVALTNARPADNRLRRMPDNAMETMAREARRKVDRNGIVRWDGAEYESPDWHGCWVIARRPAVADAGGIVLEHELTGERCIARPYAPRAYGEVRGVAKTSLEVLRAEAPAADAGADVYAERASSPGVTRMRARSEAAAPLADPLDAGHCRDLNEALALFVRLYGRPLYGGARDQLAEEIIENGFERQAIAEMAAELAAMDKQTLGG